MAPQLLGNCDNHKPSVPTSDQEAQCHVDRIQRAQWLRAAILGANDGLLSTTSLMLGISAAKEDRMTMVFTGFAGAVAGACSMAVGEFVSVSMQRDIEKMANQQNYKTDPLATNVKMKMDGGSVNGAFRGSDVASPAMTPGRILPVTSLRRSPTMKVITEDVVVDKREFEEENAEEMLPNPLKAAAASAAAFLCGSMVPIVSTMFIKENEIRIVMLAVVTSIALAIFGGVGAYLGSSRMGVSALRVLVGGWISMVVTFGLLKPFKRDQKGKDAD
ncbi:vacuolar iron transporter homolog 2-like [Tasmannia lanceolata]|uniref:vacuolar iron transporter homolog 2-like n=1 Tax=Tasmannia lanceolata TaxID=3420 RepID=UPI0040635DAA